MALEDKQSSNAACGCLLLSWAAGGRWSCNHLSHSSSPPSQHENTHALHHSPGQHKAQLIPSGFPHLIQGKSGAKVSILRAPSTPSCVL